MASDFVCRPRRCSSSSSSSIPGDSIPFSSQGLLLNSTPAIRNFLSFAASSSSLSDSLSACAYRYAEVDVVPYSLVRDVWVEMPSSSRPQLWRLFAGAIFCLPSPKLREKSPELKVRLEKLQDLADRKAYNELVKDVTRSEQKRECFSSYKDQFGFGLHVMVTMFTGYLVGFALFRAQFGDNIALHTAGGLLGLVIAMLVETLLFIIRFSRAEERPLKSRFKKHD
eukprot:c21395_g1_i2 orf=238-912(+)